MSRNDNPLNQKKTPRLDMAKVREGLGSRHDNPYWRSMEELAKTEQFQEFIDDEFPNRSSLIDIDRRDFIKFMGASMLLAGIGTVGGCRWLPQEKIVPYVKAPEDFIPGKALHFASACTFGGYTTGVLVQSHMGRPTKVDGNPDHPASLGGLDAIQQASILTMYDPDRSQNVLSGTDSSTLELFLEGVRKVLDVKAKAGGDKFRILTETITSPTLEAQIAQLLAAFPGAKWHQWEPVGRDGVKAGSNLAFGKIVNTIYSFDKAQVILSLDADFLVGMPGSVRYAHDFIQTRKVVGQHPKLSRLYVVESSPTLAGASADHRMPLKPSQIGAFAQAVAGKLGVGAGGALPQGVSEAWVNALVADLQAAKGASIVIPGEYASPEVHALAHAMNQALGNVGQTVNHTESIEAEPVIQIDSLKELVADMKAGKVGTLLIMGDMNPVYSAPADLGFKEALSKVKTKVHFGTYVDETAAVCDWHVPQAHYLEAWSDGRAFDGTASIVQPLIAPLYKGISAHELIAHLVGKPQDGYDIVRSFWKLKGLGGAGFENAWRDMLNSGVVPDTQAPPVTVTASTSISVQPVKGGAFEVIFRPDPTVWDGRLANNGWLQELPKPLSQMTWDNSAQMSPATAAKLQLQDDDFVYLNCNNQKIKAQVVVMPGHPDDAVTAHLGYGRTVVGQVGQERGFDAYPMRTSTALWWNGGLTVEPAHERPDGLAKTQMYFAMEGRDIVRAGTVAAYAKHPNFKPEESIEGEMESMYPENPTPWPDQPDHYQWALTIDLNQCIGCNACVTACQSENNIPIVGKAQVLRGRVMHWLRIDRYYRVNEGAHVVDAELDNSNDLDSKKIETVFMPVACMHCEKAPCEPVCPVAATVHSHEGLNQMVYNRCVGTRYCSNNCPYKVRRFNYLNYGDKTNGNLYLNFRLNEINNPNVTVRGRGVMEKCTYCVQRINEARIEAKKRDVPIKDGEVVTACQQACPTNAIVFGNMADQRSAVSQSRGSGRNYTLLQELGTIPRTTYLTKLRNPNPELEKA